MKDVARASSPPVSECGQDARATLQQAAEWRLLSLLLERPKAAWHQEIESLAKEIQDVLLSEAVALAKNATQETYLALLGPAGMISPRETAYIGFEDPGQLLADLMAFYKAFSFTPMSEDPPDHITVEAGFIGYLTLKEVYAELAENNEAAQITREARDRFLEIHFCRLARGFAERFPASAPPYLVKTVEALLKRIEHLPAAPVVSMEMDPLASGCPMATEEEI